MSNIGRKSDCSSNVGKRTDMKSDIASPRVNRGVPQSEQKLRVERPPLAPRTEYVFGTPLMRVAETTTTTPEAKGAPLDCWQSLQWQLSIATGSAVHS